MSSDHDSAAPRPPRRPRYRGTHPRRFEERYKELGGSPEIGMHVRAQGRTPAGTHVPILVPEVMAALAPAPGETVADCTIGFGGHAVEFARRIGPAGRLVGFDVDREQLERAGERLRETGTPFSLHVSHFAGIGKAMASGGIEGFDIIFADLGASSMQLDDPRRGFSYRQDGPLDMRMDPRNRLTAREIVNGWPEEELSRIFREFGDEPDHERIARKIAGRRQRTPLTTTFDLVGLIFHAKKISPEEWRAAAAAGKPRRRNPAARVFQALRIVVNSEFSQLEQLLRVAPYCLKPGGRIGIISFHSGEDGRVVEALREGFETGVYEIWTPEPIRPAPPEKRDNPRSAPAIFRWARRSAARD